MSNIPFQIFAWVSSIFYALSLVATKLASKHSIKNPWLLNFFYMGLVFALIVPFAVNNHAIGLPARWNSLLWASVFAAIAGLLFIFAVFKMDASSLGPLFNIRTVFAVLLGFLFLGERLTVLQTWLILGMIGGGALVSLDERLSWRSVFSLGGMFVTLEMFTLAVMAIFIKKSIAEIGFWQTNFWMFLLAQVLYCLTIPFFKNDIKAITVKQWGILAGIAILDFIGSIAAARAYEDNVGISAAIISIPLSSVIAFGFSWFAPELLEKHSLKIYALRFLGAALMVYAGIKLV